MPTRPLEQAATLMARFAERTGIESAPSPRRYLWTDAFAVRNFLALHAATGIARWEELAVSLVGRVHEVLAPSRDAAHPTAAGLRIGKKLPERSADEPYDEQLEWDRDGQYFHYLTQWMHALDQVASRLPRASRWACELAAVAHRAFVRGNRMYWKMSVDLTRPLVTSMGQHDPLDGYVTFLHLAARWPDCAGLDSAIAELHAMIDRDRLTTSDPLGIGGMLVDATRLRNVIAHYDRGDRRLLDELVAASVVGMQRCRGFRGDASGRLAFRELGLSIGLAASEALPTPSLRPFLPLRGEIESFWLDPVHRANSTWLEHEDINDVMLATSLLASPSPS
jgi:hypothetical protein